MASAAGTVILQDDGSVTLDEDGNELLSDGSSDCDCCPADCCTVDGCSFDQTHARLQGRITCTVNMPAFPGLGIPAHTVYLQFDFNVNMDICGGNFYYRQVNGTTLSADNSDGSHWVDVAAVIYQVDGVDTALDDPTWFVGIAFAVIPRSAGLWGMEFDFSGGSEFAHVNLSTGAVGGQTNIAGGCAGFASLASPRTDSYTQSGGSGNVVDSSIYLAVTNNEGCAEEGFVGGRPFGFGFGL